MSPLLFRRLSDETLGSRLASGEAAAFDELYRRYVNRLAAYGAHLLGDAGSGDDVAQATLLKAYTALRDGRVPDRVKPWLYRIAHNTAIDTVSRRRELPAAELPEHPAPGGEPVAGALVAALASLPERQRRVYTLRELHGLRIDETAAELGLTVPQVEQALFAARNRLAEHLVFGDRLNCVAVQRLAAGPLDVEERRALKTHLRSCPGCRRELGLRGRALGLLPAAPFGWLRGLLTGMAGGGAPVAAKIGTVVATATVAAGVPVAVEVHWHGTRPAVAAAATALEAPSHGRAPSPAGVPIGRLVSVAPLSARRGAATGEIRVAEDSRSRSGDGSSGEASEAVAQDANGASGSGDGARESGDGGSSTAMLSGGDAGGDGGDHHAGSGSQPARTGESGGGSTGGQTTTTERPSSGEQTQASDEPQTSNQPQTSSPTQTTSGQTSTPASSSGGDGAGDGSTTATTTTSSSDGGSGDTLTTTLPTATAPAAPITTPVPSSDG